MEYICSIVRDNEFVFTHVFIGTMLSLGSSNIHKVSAGQQWWVVPCQQPTTCSLELWLKGNQGILQQRKIMEDTTHEQVAPCLIIILFLLCSVNAYPSTLARLVFRLAMHVGNCIVLNMGSSLTVKCLVIILWDVEMIHLTLSSVRQELVNMFREQCL